ncbi:MAG: UDP-glucose/GDP-mannose dehydrogenase family protein [Candidatus Babeliales bacterium]|jgi:UDPglucose 6-dehydrogenase
MSKLAVIGAGYVGLVTGACFAHKGHNVIIIDNNQDKINALIHSTIPFFEPGLDTIVMDALSKGTITFATGIQEAMAQHPEVIFNCVGTPSLSNGAADLSYVEHAAYEVGHTITHPALIVNKSTVPVGTARTVKNIIERELHLRNLVLNIDVASNPEFLKEGDAVNDFNHPDRIVVGTETEAAATTLRNLYQSFITDEHQFVVMSIESAELTKYAANTMLAMRISFMNQLAQLADKVGADIEEIKRGISGDQRIGKHFLNAGIGYGGSCFPKDVKALIHMGTENLFPMTLIQEVDHINAYQRQWFINRICSHYGPTLAHKTVGIWGLAFKPNTDDIRHAPSLDLIDELIQRGSHIIAYDPAAQDNIGARYGQKISFASTWKEILQQTDFLVVLTEWKEFSTCDAHDFLSLVDKTVFDGRNCFDPVLMKKAGVNYFCVGRKNAASPTKDHFVPAVHSPFVSENTQIL